MTMYRIWQQLPSDQWVALELASRDRDFLQKVADLYVSEGHAVAEALEIREEVECDEMGRLIPSEEESRW